jgi:Tfp pilus assembly protein PilX
MRRRLADEQGIALVMALGMLIVLSITTVSVLTYTGQNARNLRYTDGTQRAVHVAEGGLNEAFSILANSSDPRLPEALPDGSTAFAGGGSASWSGTVNGDTWTVSSTGTVANPSGGTSIQRTISSQIRIGVDGVGMAPAWQFTYTDDTSTCMSLSQSAAIAVPFYIRGNLCLSNSANPIAEEITVKGTITLRNTSQIGSASNPITALHTSGCSTSLTGPWTLANCTPANGVYAETVDSTFANVAKPTVDLTYWYNYAKPGPKTNCTSGSFPGGFDNNTTFDRSLSTVELLPSTGYSCTVTSGSSTLGKIIWTPGGNSSPGTLQISGVIFIDGNVDVSVGQAVYSGRATIYSAGKVTFSNTAFLCGASACNVDTWDGETSMITFVAGSSTDSDGFVARNSAKFQGGVYAVNDVRQSQTALIEGPVIARQYYIENSSIAQKWPPIDFVSYGAPAPIGSTKLVPVSGSWSN